MSKGAKVIDFHKTVKYEEPEKDTESWNIVKDIEDRNKRCLAYESDEMVDYYDWNGECFRAFFNKVCRELADTLDVDQWDVFAAFIHKFERGGTR